LDDDDLSLEDKLVWTERAYETYSKLVTKGKSFEESAEYSHHAALHAMGMFRLTENPDWLVRSAGAYEDAEVCYATARESEAAEELKDQATQVWLEYCKII
jgi:hypothetical protein